MIRERIVSAVLDQQLESFLQSIGELNRVVEGRATCSVCNSVTTLKTVSLVIPKDDQVTYVCTRQVCMVQYALGRGTDD